MLTITNKTRASFRDARLAELSREVIAHAHRKIVIKVPHDASVVSEKLQTAFKRAYTFLSSRNVDHYDSYVYLTICYFFIGDSTSDVSIQSWMNNELISPITRAKTLYFLLKNAATGKR